MSNPRTITKGTKEFKNLQAVAKMLEADSANGYRYEVEDCYFDFGQDWMQTTIICHNDSETGVLHSWQAINPRQWDLVTSADCIGGLVYAVEDIVSGKYFGDR